MYHITAKSPCSEMVGSQHVHTQEYVIAWDTLEKTPKFWTKLIWAMSQCWKKTPVVINLVVRWCSIQDEICFVFSSFGCLTWLRVSVLISGDLQLLFRGASSRIEKSLFTSNCGLDRVVKPLDHSCTVFWDSQDQKLLATLVGTKRCSG